MAAVPVRSETHRGWGAMNGLLRFENGMLWLEHQTNDTVFGVLRSRPRQTAVPLEQVVSISNRWSFKFWWKLWVAPVIELQLGNLNVARDIPGAEGGHAQFLVRWQHRRQARALVAEVESVLAEMRYHKLNAEIERMARAHSRPATSDANVGAADAQARGFRAAPGRSESE
jgi:hypothetical protein